MKISGKHSHPHSQGGHLCVKCQVLPNGKIVSAKNKTGNCSENNDRVYMHSLAES